MKTLLILLAISAAVGLVACQSLEKIFAITDEKVTTVPTQAPLERQYTAFGPHAVAMHKWPAGDDTLKTFTAYYPQAGGAYPLVVMANGTGMQVSKYEPVLKHLASWGFVVIGNEEEHSWSGQGASRALDFALAQSRDSSSPLHRKIDAGKVGVAGHSQGGVGAINLANSPQGTSMVRSLYTASTSRRKGEANLWDFHPWAVQQAYFAVTSNGEFDRKLAPIATLHETLRLTPSAAPQVVAERQGVDHGAMLYTPNGYMAAWFLYTLTNDAQAAQVFTGTRPEIRRNANWQGMQSKNTP